MLLEILETRLRKRIPGIVPRIPLPDSEQALGLLIRKRLEQNGANNGENRRVGAYGQSKCENYRNCERRGFPQLPDRIAEIA
jgi:hypothetical protein